MARRGLGTMVVDPGGQHVTVPSKTRTGAEPLMDLSEVARRLGVNERHIRRLVAERRIPFIKWGHLLRFDPHEIDAWIDTNRRRSDTA